MYNIVYAFTLQALVWYLSLFLSHLHIHGCSTPSAADTLSQGPSYSRGTMERGNDLLKQTVEFEKRHLNLMNYSDYHSIHLHCPYNAAVRGVLLNVLEGRWVTNLLRIKKK